VPGELSGGGQTFGAIVDPCTKENRNLNATRAANCAADGVPAGYDPDQTITQSVSGFSGANANLKPEKGDTLTYGFVWQPASLKGFSLTVDRFEMEIEDVITTVERQTAVDLCYDTASRLLCSARTRGTHALLPGANYVLTAVDETQQNVATLTTKGVDIDVRYGFKTQRFGDFDLGLTTTIYDKASWIPIAGQATQNLLGYAGGSTALQGYIRVTANGNVGWKMGAFRANWNVRYIGSADMGLTTTQRGFPKIGAHDYHNVRGSYAVSKNLEVYAGITNLFDKKPPLFATGSSGTQALDTIPGYYDVFGRSYFVGMNAKF
jgi:outer membrane receptor protein involved in Fe transport